MNDKTHPTSVRLPEELKGDLLAISEQEGRSLNKQIVFILQSYVRAYKSRKKKG